MKLVVLFFVVGIIMLMMVVIFELIDVFRFIDQEDFFNVIIGVGIIFVVVVLFQEFYGDEICYVFILFNFIIDVLIVYSYISVN